MSTSALVLLLIAAFMHATWNYFVKSSKNPLISISEINFYSGLLALPILIFSGLVSSEAWGWVILSAVLRQIYYISISYAYVRGNFGQIYPILRGLNPVFILVSGLLVLGQKPGQLAVIGVLAICVGIMVTAVSRVKQSQIGPMTIALCAMSGLLVASFSTVDGIGVLWTKNSSPASYTAMLAVFDGFSSGIIAFLARKKLQQPFLLVEQKLSLIGGAIALLSYWIVIYAVTLVPIGVVSALRETSIVFALLISIIYAKEKINLTKIAGICMIVTGIAFVNF